MRTLRFSYPQTVRLALVSAAVLWAVAPSRAFSAYWKPEEYSLRRLQKAEKLAQNLTPRFGFFGGTTQMKNIFYLAKFPFQETQKALFDLLESSINAMTRRKAGNPEAEFENVRYFGQYGSTADWALQALASVTTSEQLNDADAAVHRLVRQLRESQPLFADRLWGTWYRSYSEMTRRHGRLPSLARSKENLKQGKAIEPLPSESPDGPSGSSDTPASVPFARPNDSPIPDQHATTETKIKSMDDLPYLREYLSKQVKEQDEAVDAIIRIEARKLAHGVNEETEILCLMGLPGNGKDWITENYVDAVYGYEGAYKDHLFRLGPLASAGEAWEALGAPPGHVDSDKLPGLVRYIVKHSGGRYRIKLGTPQTANTGPREYVEENPDWKPGMVLPGYEPPERAFIFVNEWHDWSKQAKNIVLKEAFEKGIFRLKNANQGVGYLQVPVTFLVASNYGMELLTSTELNGRRYGPEKTHDELVQTWEPIHSDKGALRGSIMNSQNGIQTSYEDDRTKGTSREVGNRVPDSNLILLKPLSPDALREEVENKLARVQRMLSGGQAGLKGLKLEFSSEIVEFAQAYHFNAEENARPMGDRVSNLIEATLFDAILAKKIASDGSEQRFKVDLDPQDDGTTSLLFVQLDSSGAEVGRFSQPIKITSQDRDPEPLSDERIAQVLDLPQKLGEQVFGIEHITPALMRSALTLEQRTRRKYGPQEQREGATVSMFLGLSSTGKSETALAEARALTGSDDSVKIIDFSTVKTPQDMREKILGSKNGYSEAVKSEFMKHYDRYKNSGPVTFVFDEISNAPPEALLELYEILRVPFPQFSDGEDRPMDKVRIYLTGNTGQEWYKDIPKEIPEIEYQAALESVYEEAMKRPEFQQQFLEKHFTPGFLNRIERVYFFGPLSFKAIRQLTELNLSKALKKLKPVPGVRGWEMGFPTAEDALRVVEDFESQGYIIDKQAASINNYVNVFYKTLNASLLEKRIPSGARVSIRSLGLEEREKRKRVLKLEVRAEGSAEPWVIELSAKDRANHPEISAASRYITAIHEAGHELVRRILFGDRYKSVRITVLPGVAQFANSWIRYLGLAESEKQKYFSMTRSALTAEIAVLFGGQAAQQLISYGDFEDSGQSNDLQIATQLALHGVLRWGLSSKWGSHSIPSTIEFKDYLPQLSNDQRTLLFQEVDALLNEGRALARAVLIKNRENALLPMGEQLVSVGDMHERDLDAFYEKHSLNREIAESDLEIGRKFVPTQRQNTAFAIEAELLPGITVPKNIIDVNELAKERRALQVRSVPLRADFPIWNPTTGAAAPASDDLCVATLRRG